MDDTRDTETTELPENVEAPDEDAPSSDGPVVASYAVRVHLRRPQGVEEFPTPTLRELESMMARALNTYEPGTTATVSAERIDK